MFAVFKDWIKMDYLIVPHRVLASMGFRNEPLAFTLVGPHRMYKNNLRTIPKVPYVEVWYHN